MTKAEAIEHLKDILCDVPNDKCIDWIEALNKAIESLKQEPCEDAISRQAVIDGIEELKKSPWATDKHGNGFEYLITEALDVVAELCVKQEPSVTSHPKMGRWIEVDIGNCHATLKCSVCDRVIEPTFTFGEYSYEDINRYYPYCHCGAKMEVE